MHQHGLFDIQMRHDKIKQYATMLDQLNTIVNWEEFRPTLEIIRNKERKSNAGRKPFDVFYYYRLLLSILPVRSAAAVACSKYWCCNRCTTSVMHKWSSRLPTDFLSWLFWDCS